MKRITIEEEVDVLKDVVEMYRNSWFIDGQWRGDPS